VHLQALTPLMTSLTLSVVCGICARSHHQVSDDADTFTISPFVAYLMIVLGIFFCVAPFLPGAAGDIPATLFFWYFAPFWLGAFIASAFFFRYRVIVRDDALIYGAFHRRVILFSAVIDFDVLQSSKSSELCVYLKSGERLKFSGMLSDFEELVGMVNSHMASLPGPQHDSPAKLHDQDKRKRDNRSANWFMVIGVSIVALFVFVLWRMQLLY
jgi:hypothetical protein